MISVERFAGGEEEWDVFAAAQSGYTHFHRLRWRALIGDVFGHECVYLAARTMVVRSGRSLAFTPWSQKRSRWRDART